jgi:hypothetical protein
VENDMTCPDNYPCNQQDEKIAVRRIRIFNGIERTTAVVASFFAADRVLRDWLLVCRGKVLDCDFEIVYDDGVVLSGHYQCKRKGGCRPALMSFVCKHLEASGKQGKPCAGFPLRGLTAVPSVFLARYETEDFAQLH